jgi:hypothetical protein
MKDKVLFASLKGKNKFKGPKELRYWIAAISYLIIFSLSILCLVAYLPSLPDEIHTNTMIFLIAVLIIGTVAFGWETLQWRKRRAQEGQPNVEDIINSVNKDLDNSH